jgi:hypothetical protein
MIKKMKLNYGVVNLQFLKKEYVRWGEEKVLLLGAFNFSLLIKWTGAYN